MKYKILLIMLVLLGNTLMADSLKNVLNNVLKTNPAVIEKLKYYNAAIQEKNSYRSLYRGTLRVEGEVGHEQIANSTTNFRGEDDFVKSARVVYNKMIFDGKMIRNDINSRHSLMRAAIFDYSEAANRIAFETIDKYVNVLKFAELLVQAEDNIVIHRQILDSVKSRFSSGMGAKSELDRVQGRLAAAQSKHVLFRNKYKNAVYNLQKYLGYFLDSDKMSLPKLNVKLLPNSLDSAIRKQAYEHPLLVSADYNISYRIWEYKREISDYAPRLDFESSRTWRHDYSGIPGNENDTRFLLKFKYDLYDGGIRKAKIGRLLSLVHKEKQALDRVKRSLVNDLQLTWSGYKLLSTQIGTIRKTIFFTKQALRSYKEEFRLGKRNLINILDAENEHQNAKNLLINTTHDLIIAKYRILYSIGSLIEDLRLSLPYCKKLKKVKNPKRIGRDRLPINKDVDNDKIVDRRDISPNSPKPRKVDKLGTDKLKSKIYLQDTVETSRKRKRNTLIHNKKELITKPIQPNVATELEFISFVKGSLKLTKQSKIVFREIISQLKKLAGEGVSSLTVSTDEKSSASANYAFALQRAYNIKKILVLHNFDPESIMVFAGMNKKKKSSLVVQVNTDPDSFKNVYDTLSYKDLFFYPKSIAMKKVAFKAIDKFVSRIKTMGKIKIDVISYSNDYDNASKNIALSRKRANVLITFISLKRINLGIIVPVAWGNYDSSTEIFNTAEEMKIKNKIVFSIRNK